MRQIMNNTKVRLESIEINNLKNVKRGLINLTSPKKNYSASILGLYGQNGSGKTTLIDALALLKLILTGERISEKYADYINIDCSYASLTFCFAILINKDKMSEYYVEYSFKMRRDLDETSNNRGQNTKYRLSIFDECLSASIKSNNHNNKITKLIDTNTDKVFLPITKFKTLVGNDKEKE